MHTFKHVYILTSTYILVLEEQQQNETHDYWSSQMSRLLPNSMNNSLGTHGPTSSYNKNTRTYVHIHMSYPINSYRMSWVKRPAAEVSRILSSRVFWNMQICGRICVNWCVCIGACVFCSIPSFVFFEKVLKLLRTGQQETADNKQPITM